MSGRTGGVLLVAIALGILAVGVVLATGPREDSEQGDTVRLAGVAATPATPAVVTATLPPEATATPAAVSTDRATAAPTPGAATTALAPSPEAPAPGGAVAPTTLGLVFRPPGSMTVIAGEVFVFGLLLVNPRQQPLDGVQVHLDFDPNALELAEPPEPKEAPEQVFPLVLQRRLDQATGQIDLALGRDFRGQPVTSGATLATLAFKAKGPVEATRIRVSDSGVRRTAAAGGGQALFLDLSLASLSVSAVR